MWGSGIGKPHPVELRARALAFVAGGPSHRAAASRSRVSVKLGNRLGALDGATCGLQLPHQGNGGGHGKLEPVRAWPEARGAQNGDLAADTIRWPNRPT